ncbi:MAG TPA: molecular chaperone HtpG [Campylobacteraceae bacterium]|nr:molecular chaperone HtpG [Campylobacteraceae bacterium]
MSKFEYQTEVSQLLDLMIHSLYSNKEIFLRELISNASDALDKLNYLTLTDDKFKELKYEPRIDIRIDKEKKTLTVSDTGIGMSKEDLKKNLGTIAKSGTKSFVEKLSGDAKKDSALIGQFGVGFYSAFMVAKKIEVLSKKAGTKTAWLWISEGGSEYEIKEAQKEGHGTEITLYLREGEEEFLEEYRIRAIVEKYSNHIQFPIYLETEVETEGKKEKKVEQINKASALWRLPKSQISDEEYKDFYKTISHDNEDPLLWIHTKAEGTIEYTTLFYIPQNAPFDLYRVDYQSGIKLYVKRVFISDDDKELLPTYLRFVRGIVDVEDLPLNVSREILQQNVILSKIKKASTKKILTELKKLKENDFEKYLKFYKIFGKVLKEGIMSEFEFKDLLLDLLLFKSNKRDELVDFETYVKEMQEGQKEIYYIIGDDAAMLKNSPLLESFNEKGTEVLLMDDEVDAIVIPNIQQYKEYPLKAVNSTDVEEADESKIKEAQEKLAEVLVKMKEMLKEEVKDVKVTTRLKKSPAVLVYDKEDPDFAMQQMLKQMGQVDLPPVKPILEINPDHEIFQKIVEKKEYNKLGTVAHTLLDLAKLSEGMKINDPADFSNRIYQLLEKSL